MNITKQYLAGIIDGEGFVWIGKKKDTRIKRGFTLRYRVKITNQHKGLLEAIKEKYGGRLCLKKNQKECWDLIIYTKQEIMLILKDILPYLIVKKEIATKLFELLKQRKKQYQGKRLSEEIINEYR